METYGLPQQLINDLENITPKQLTKEYYSLFYNSPQYQQYFASYYAYSSLDLEEDLHLAEALDSKMFSISENLIDELIEQHCDEDCYEHDYEVFREVIIDKLLEGFGVIDVVGLCCELRGSCFDKFGAIRKVLEEV